MNNQRTILLGAVLVLFCLCRGSAHAQNPTGISPLPDPPLLGRIDSGETIYLVQNPEMIVGPSVTSVLFSPDSRAVLVAREVRTAAPESLLGKASQAPGEVNLSLWRTRTRRAAVLWRHPLEPGQTVLLQLKGWMGSTGFALATMLSWSKDRETGKPVYGCLSLIIDTASGTVRETAIPANMGWLSLSPTRPYAALLSAEGASSDSMRFLGPEGTLSEPLAVPGFIWFSGWSEDGTTMRGFYRTKDTSAKQWIAVDPAARTVTNIPAPPTNAAGETDAGPGASLPVRLPLTLTTRPSTEGAGAAAAGAAPPAARPGPEIWLEDTQDSRRAVRITREGTPFGLLPNLSGVVYRMAGGLYFAPLVTAGKAPTPAVPRK